MTVARDGVSRNSHLRIGVSSAGAVVVSSSRFSSEQAARSGGSGGSANAEAANERTVGSWIIGHRRPESGASEGSLTDQNHPTTSTFESWKPSRKCNSGAANRSPTATPSVHEAQSESALHWHLGSWLWGSDSL